MKITTAAAVARAHTMLSRRDEVGLAPDEAALLREVSSGDAFLSSLAEVGACFGVDATALRRWGKWDEDGALTAAPSSIREIELLRDRMIHAGQRIRLRDSDFSPRLRRETGL